MLKHYVLFIFPALLFLGCGGYESVCYNNQYCYDDDVNDKKEFTDERDGKIYKSIKIGKQTWMAENLNYYVSNARCYDDEPDNCKIFGEMYKWETAKTVCPFGWHLPKDSDFELLGNTVETMSGCKSCAGIILKANSDLWALHKGTDEFGFTALPGGFYRNDTDGFTHKNLTAGFWSATEGYMQGSAHFRYFTSSNASLNNTLNKDGFWINDAFAYVRCIKD